MNDSHISALAVAPSSPTLLHWHERTVFKSPTLVATGMTNLNAPFVQALPYIRQQFYRTRHGCGIFRPQTGQHLDPGQFSLDASRHRPDNANTVFAALEGILKTTNEGGVESVIHSGVIRALAIDRPILQSSMLEERRSRQDHGRRSQLATAGLAKTNVRSLVIVPMPGNYLAGTFGGVFKTTNAASPERGQ